MLPANARCYAARACVYHREGRVAARAHVHTRECVLLRARVCITGGCGVAAGVCGDAGGASVP